MTHVDRIMPSNARDHCAGNEVVGTTSAHVTCQSLLEMETFLDSEPRYALFIAMDTTKLARLSKEAEEALKSSAEWLPGAAYKPVSKNIDICDDNPELRNRADPFVRCFTSEFWPVSLRPALLQGLTWHRLTTRNSRCVTVASMHFVSPFPQIFRSTTVSRST